MGIDLSQFHATFFEECFEGLDFMTSSLLDMDHLTGVDTELLDTLFRAAHSIKGGSGTFGFGKVSEFTHTLETLLDKIRCKDIDIDQGIINILLEAVDCTREMLLAEKDETVLDEYLVGDIRGRLEIILLGEQVSVADVVNDE